MRRGELTAIRQRPMLGDRLDGSPVMSPVSLGWAVGRLPKRGQPSGWLSQAARPSPLFLFAGRVRRRVMTGP